MTRLLYDIEDYLEDASQAERLPRWMRRIVLSIGRTVGETGDLIVPASRRILDPRTRTTSARRHCLSLFQAVAVRPPTC